MIHLPRRPPHKTRGAGAVTPFRRALAHTLAVLFVCVTSDVAADPPTRGGANMAKKLFRGPKSEA